MHCLCLLYIVAKMQPVLFTPAILYRPGGWVTMEDADMTKRCCATDKYQIENHLAIYFDFHWKFQSPCLILNPFGKMCGLPLALSWWAYYSRSCFYHKCCRENLRGGWESSVDLGEVTRESVWAEHCLSCPSWGSRVSSHLDERKTWLCASPNAPL